MLLVAAGCGGDKAPSKSEYVKKANAVCAASGEKTQAALRGVAKNPDKPTPAEAQAMVKKIVPLVRKSVAGGRSLTVPEGEGAKIKAIYDAADRGTDAFERASSSPQASRKVLASLGSAQDPYGQANSLARAYGLNVCAE